MSVAPQAASAWLPLPLAAWEPCNWPPPPPPPGPPLRLMDNQLARFMPFIAVQKERMNPCWGAFGLRQNFFSPTSSTLITSMRLKLCKLCMKQIFKWAKADWRRNRFSKIKSFWPVLIPNAGIRIWKIFPPSFSFHFENPFWCEIKPDPTSSYFIKIFWEMGRGAWEEKSQKGGSWAETSGLLAPEY